MPHLATHEWPPRQTDAGAAAPVAVLVHGITGWWRTWWRVGPALAEHGWRVIAVDLPGHGGSPSIEGMITRDEAVAELAATIEALRIAPVDVIIGHSLGAAVVMDLTHRRPELARRVVLEDPPGTDRSVDVPFQEQLQREVHAARERPEDEIARMLAENATWLEEDARQNVDGLQRCDITGISASIRSGMGSRVSALVAELRVPALYLLAAADGRSAIGGEQRAQLLAGVPSGSRALQLDSGHTIHRDRFDDYMATVLDWLDEVRRA
jgi:pimeloyl-ACP methyl ester carboxylesterase